MERYWATPPRSPSPTPLNLGIGITATSEGDARALVAARFGSDLVIEAIRVIEDMGSIDQGHVAPNMGNASVRGIWFPLGV